MWQSCVMGVLGTLACRRSGSEFSCLPAWYLSSFFALESRHSIVVIALHIITKKYLTFTAANWFPRALPGKRFCGTDTDNSVQHRTERSRHIFSVVCYHITYGPNQVPSSAFSSLINQEHFQNPEPRSTLRSLGEDVLRGCVNRSLRCPACHGIAVCFSSNTKLALRGRGCTCIVAVTSSRDVS